VVDGAPRFEITAGVRDEFAAWKFAKPGKVALGVVQSVVSPSVIELEMTTTAGAVQPRKPAAGQAVEEIPLVPDTSNDSFTQIASRISKTLDQFTTVQTGHTEPATMELADAIHNMDEVTASLAGRLPAADEDPAVRPPIDRLVENLATTSSNLAIMTASLDATVGKDGRVDTALDAVNADLQHLKDTIDTTTRTITDLDAGVDSSLGQMNGLVNQIAVTMSTLNGTLDRVGNTFVGRMLIAKPKGATSPTPPTSSARAPRETH
jgi:ABC-type transporter Mla subunit MlaD